MSRGLYSKALSKIALASSIACFFLPGISKISLLWIVDVDYIIQNALNDAYSLELVGVLVEGELFLCLAEDLADPSKVPLLHLDQGLGNESIVDACLLQLLYLCRRIQIG